MTSNQYEGRQSARGRPSQIFSGNGNYSHSDMNRNNSSSGYPFHQPNSPVRPPVLGAVNRPSYALNNPSSTTTATHDYGLSPKSLSRPPIIRPSTSFKSSLPTTPQPTSSPSIAESLDSQPLSKQAQKIKKIDDFGVIISVKETFGFIQPLKGEEQIYYGEREAYSGISVGDEVCYIKQSSSKGFHAERLRLVNVGAKEYITNLVGVIIREVDIHKGLPGLIEMTEGSFKTQVFTDKRIASIIQAYGPLPPIPYFIDDVIVGNGNPSPSASANSPNKKLFKGDEISFSLVFIPGSPYLKGSSLTFTKSKRDRLLSEQIKNMLDAGVKRESGVIDTIKNDEYGFIRPLERSEQIFFRIDDVIDENVHLAEEMEVEFFVISESFKGKLTDRAVHLRILPQGTVQFEVTIASQAIGHVLDETKSLNQSFNSSSSSEIPGKILLKNPIAKSDSSLLTNIELWQRCLPTDLQLFVGDEIKFDIHHFRPENLYFARSVEIIKYRKISREFGVIISIVNDTSRKTSGFGFIKSYLREIDLYFRVSDVRDVNGALVPETNLRTDQIVSFDVTIDSANSSSSNSSSMNRLKAIRVQIVDHYDSSVLDSSTGKRVADFVDINATDHSITDNSNATTDTINELKVALIKRELRGLVLRDVIGKKESPQPGNIQILPEYFTDDIKDGKFHSIEIIDALEEFISNPVLTDIIIKNLTTSQRRAYYEVITDMFSQSLDYESIQLPPGSYSNSDPSKGKALKIFKLKSKDGNISKSQSTVRNRFSDFFEVDDPSKTNKQSKKILSRTNDNAPTVLDNIVLYQKADVSEIFGPLAKDLEVVFDLCLDRRTLKKVAKNIRLTDDPIEPNCKECVIQYGVIEAIVGVRSGKFGFIRSIPTDEKLFWHCSSIVATQSKVDEGFESNKHTAIDYESIHAGQEVSYELRRRGGIRCATNITLLTMNSLSHEEILPDNFLAFVVDNNTAILLDVTHSKYLSSKLWNIQLLLPTVFSSMHGIDIDKTVDAAASGKYFPAIGRELLPIYVDYPVKETTTIQSLPAIGSFVSCQVIVNWSINRHPIGICNVQVIDKPVIPNSTMVYNSPMSSAADKVKGVLTKVKIKGDVLFPAPSTVLTPELSSYHSAVLSLLSALEFCEIQCTIKSVSDSSSATTSVSIAHYYCLYNEVLTKAAAAELIQVIEGRNANAVGISSRDSPQVGDSVDFYPMLPHRLALCPILAPKVYL